MKTNAQIILDRILDKSRQSRDPDSTASRFFEFFTADQILKDYDLSDAELASGQIGGSQDGGIDGIYLFVNGALVDKGPDYTNMGNDITIDLVIIQCKTGTGFKETPIERFITVTDNILDLDKSITSFHGVYHDQLINAATRFQSMYNKLTHQFPRLNLRYYYACKGNDPNENIRRKVEQLKDVVTRHFPYAVFEFHYLGASELLALTQKSPRRTYTLDLAENPISSARGQGGFVCLVRLVDFFHFISDDRGMLQRSIFDANVRDYQGKTQVNKEIQSSLQSLRNPSAEDFWWLNNGVSILSTRASFGGKVLTMEDPQIVNGLQTSEEIHKYFRSSSPDDEDRQLLVRVIVPKAEDSRDRIIKATNSQTVVQQSSLRATDKIHLNIEEYLKSKNLYYDRRKNYYKNQNMPRGRIISISYLAQAVMAIVLESPDTARARPSSLLKADTDYRRVFSMDYNINLYYVCVEVMRQIERLMRQIDPQISTKDRNNLKFYIAICVVAEIIAPAHIVPEQVAQLDLNKIDIQIVKRNLGVVQKIYERLGGTDEVAKGSNFLREIDRSLSLSLKRFR